MTLKELTRLDAATKGGLVGMIAGRVRTRDQLVVNGAAVLIGLRFVDTHGLLIGFGVAGAVTLVGALVIRMWKAWSGVPRDSIEY